MGKTVGFIGAGNMATAIIDGVIKNKSIDKENIYVYDIDENAVNRMVTQKGINSSESVLELQKKSDIIVLAVKPQTYSVVLAELKKEVDITKVFVTIAAGISIAYIQKELECACPCVRAMPNTPLLLGQGATAICPSENIDEQSYGVIYNMFAMSGVCKKLPESLMNTVIAVNGSSPAYIYLFAKAMVDFAVEQGIEESTALSLVCATLKGSASMLEKSGDTPSELIDKVCSKGGTTIEAIKTLEEKDFYSSIKLAMQNCNNRAEELGK